MDNIHPDDRIVTVMVVTTSGAVIPETVPNSKLHDVFVKHIHENGWVEAFTLPWGVIYVDEDGKQHSSDLNWTITTILHDEHRLGTSEFIVGNAVIVGPADEEGWAYDVNMEYLTAKYPQTFA